MLDELTLGLIKVTVDLKAQQSLIKILIDYTPKRSCSHGKLNLRHYKWPALTNCSRLD